MTAALEDGCGFRGYAWLESACRYVYVFKGGVWLQKIRRLVRMSIILEDIFGFREWVWQRWGIDLFCVG
jgi:hypothetical protein